MDGYKLFKKISAIAKQNKWLLETRKGATTHLIVTLWRSNNQYRASIPMHKGRDLRLGTLKQILNNLQIKEFL